MANAMLEDEHFKSSHQDLVAFSSLDQFNRNITLNTLNNSTSSTNTINMVHSSSSSSNHRNHHQDGDHHHHHHHSMLRTKKSVEFLLQPSSSDPAKRGGCKPPDQQAPVRWTAKQVVEAISTSFTQQERLEAIQKTREAFQHDVTSLHDDEIAAGADAVLVKHLTFLICHAKHMVKTNVVTTSSSSSSNNSNTINNNTNNTNNNNNSNATSVAELVLTLESLEALYRASTAMVGASFARMGPELLYLLTLLVQEELDGRVAKLQQQQQANNNTTVVVQQQQQQQQQRASSSADGGGQQHAQHVSSWALLPNVMSGQQQQQQGDDMNDAVDMDLDRPSLLSSSSTTLTATMARPVTAAVIVGTPEGDEILRKAMRLFGHFARVGDATRTIAHFPGLLRALVNLVRLRPFECVPWEARLSALWTLANLACNTENMTMMVCQATTPSLVAALVEVSCRPLHPGDSVEMTMEVLRSRSIASRAILNLSWAPENKIILAGMPPSSSTASSSSGSSLSSAPLIDLLSELAVHRAAPLHRSRTVREILTTTRCHAVGALRNLAAAPRRTKIALCEYRNGHVLDILTDAALNDPDQAVRDRAFAAIHNLAIYDTAERIVNHPALVLALKDVLLSADEDEEDGAGHRRHEEGTTPKSHAQATILVLERSITPDMKAYDNLRELLQVINPTPSSDPEQDSRNNNNNNSSNDDDDDDDMGAIEATAV